MSLSKRLPNSGNREKEKLVEECTTLIQSIRQMQRSIDYDADDQSLRITLPLTQCRKVLEEKMKHTTSLHAARFEQVIGNSLSPPPPLSPFVYW